MFPSLSTLSRRQSGLLCLALIAASGGHVRSSLSDTPADTGKSEPVPLLVRVELPRLRVREYHRPYVAVWIEDESRSLKQHVAVWYQQDKNDEGHGQKWLPDLRQWWRRGGRKMDAAVDAVSGPTRSVGRHQIRVPHMLISKLPAGNYNVVVEAAREVGGRELVRLPFSWPLAEEHTVEVSGNKELGDVTLRLTPPASQ